MATPVRDAEWLARVAKLMQGSAAPYAASRISPDGFSCLLDDQPTQLVPERLLRQLPRSRGEGELCFNPQCRLSGNGGPDELGPEGEVLTTPSLAGGTVAWVEDPATDAWTPFWLGPRLSTIVWELDDSRAAIPDLAVDVRTALCNAQILIPAGYADSRRRAWSATTEWCRTKFREAGYAPIAGLLHPFQVAALRRHYRRQIRKGAIRLGDHQSARRYIAHNEPAARFFHLQLTKAASDLVGESVKPSYVYMASYQHGARLEKHTDREQCAFSITMCIDYSPEPVAATPWPLHLDTKQGTVTVCQALGDGLLYRGRDLPHYRGTLAEGNSSTSIFFHYVAEDFSGSLD